MRVFIAGIDGYIGWPLAVHLLNHGHEVGGADAYYRRDWVQEVGSHSAIPLPRMTERLEGAMQLFGRPVEFFRGDLTDYAFLENALKSFRPDAIVHLGEMPSAPYSMISAKHAAWTHANNLTGTLNMLHIMRDHFPSCHLLKLGTMGEYGTPDIDITEGDILIEHNGRSARLPFPCSPGSFYHCTKVHDSVNIRLACRLWNLRSTDVMQGVVYGTEIVLKDIADSSPLTMRTRFDFDGVFGTAINRFCAQVTVGHPITPYGAGTQRRGFLALEDSVECMRILLENPPGTGEYRVVNQFDETYTLMDLAKIVQDEYAWQWIKVVEIKNLVNPRDEAEVHHYRPESKILRDLGFIPKRKISEGVGGC